MIAFFFGFRWVYESQLHDLGLWFRVAAASERRLGSSKLGLS